MAESNRSKDVHYKGAVALNNIGVDLLHRHFYQQAAATLRDAVRCMNNHRAIRLQNQEDQTALIDLHVMLQSANHRLAFASRQTVQQRQLDQEARFRVVDFQVGCPLVLSGLVHRKEQLLSLICPARVDDLDFSSDTNNDPKEGYHGDAFEFHAASFVMNLGLASFCIAECQKGDGMMQAVRLFQMSHSILDRFCRTRSTALGVREVAQTKLVLVVGLLRAHQRLCSISASSAMDDMKICSSEALQSMLQQLVAVIQSSDTSHDCFRYGLNCAAAA